MRSAEAPRRPKVAERRPTRSRVRGPMSGADRVAGCFAVANAAAGSVMTIYVTVDGIDWAEWPILLVILAALGGAWIGAWAWWRARWGLAAVGIFLSIALPWGYFIELWAPIVLTLVVMALVNARRRRVGRAAVQAGQPGHAPPPRLTRLEGSA